jgi:hypothetical protein
MPTSPRRLNIGFPAFAWAIFHALIILDQVAPGIDISECFLVFFAQFPFTSANMMSKHFYIVRGIIMEILDRDLGLKSFPVDRCHISSAHHKKLVVSIVCEL